MGVRKQILRTAESIFRDEGVDGISMRRIAQKVGVTPTAIYRHFTNKEALVDAVTDRGFELLAEYLARPGRARTASGRLRTLMRGYIAFAMKHPHYFDFMFLLPRESARRFPGDFVQRRSETFNMVIDHVSAGMESGEYAVDDAAETALTIWAHAHGMVSLYRSGRFGGQEANFRRLFDRSMARLLRGISA